MSSLYILKRLIFAASVAALAGCEDGTGPDGAVLVTLDEFTVTPSRSSTEHGLVRFIVDNEGTEFHEFVVVKTDLTADKLPMNADGSFNEEGAGVEVIDEIEEVEPHVPASLEITLEEGHYVIL